MPRVLDRAAGTLGPGIVTLTADVPAGCVELRARVVGVAGDGSAFGIAEVFRPDGSSLGRFTMHSGGKRAIETGGAWAFGQKTGAEEIEWHKLTPGTYTLRLQLAARVTGAVRLEVV